MSWMNHLLKWKMYIFVFDNKDNAGSIVRKELLGELGI